jgi:hypothetical protein
MHAGAVSVSVSDSASEVREGFEPGRQAVAAAGARGLGQGFGWGLGDGLMGRLLRQLGALSRPRSAAQLEVLETLSLGGRRQVFLIACGGERYLVAAGADSVSALERVGGAEASGWAGSEVDVVAVAGAVGDGMHGGRGGEVTR